MAIIPFSEEINWQRETGLAVAGFGVAGACAALSARADNAEVLVLERGSGVNGTTTLATGHVYMGGGTPPQLANQLDDSAAEMYNYLVALTPDPEHEKIKLYCDDSVSHFDWLTEQGVPFNNGFYREKTVEQPTAECLIWSGNEKVWPYSEKAKPAPRGHKVAAEGGGGGALLMKALTEKAERLGIQMEFDARVDGLVAAADGSIVGLRYQQFGQHYLVRCQHGVVLATGGYIMNEAMLEQYTPDCQFERFWPQGNPNDDGSGIELGLSANGNAIRMNQYFVTSPVYPPAKILNGIAVNKHGRRFINEDSYHARFAKACLEQDDGVVYFICDNRSFARPELDLQELIDAWDDVAQMESDLGIPEGQLQDTIRQYNADAKKGDDRQFHKHSDWLQPLEEVPFGVLQCSKGLATYTGFTLGGLQVSKDGEVISESGEPVRGLYAAGACASNIAQDSNGYSSGTCIGESSYFGRRAGFHAVRSEPMN